MVINMTYVLIPSVGLDLTTFSEAPLHSGGFSHDRTQKKDETKKKSKMNNPMAYASIQRIVS